VQGLAQSLAQHPWAWGAIVALGAYHGLNPGMGWLFAVSNGMQARRAECVLRALPPLALGHFVAMLAALLPFTLFMLYFERVDAIRAAAGGLLVIFGVYKLLSRRHPRFLARIGPSHLVLWSFFIATAHGAGLMLVPVVLGLCTNAPDAQRGHQALLEVAGGSLGMTLAAVSVHTTAMLVTGGTIAWVVYRYVGLRLLRSAWVNVDLLWAALLVVAGAIALAVAL
jgi:hypothetical protein